MDKRKLVELMQTALLALCAKFFLGFRAIHQKRYRSTTHEQLDDINFLGRRMQVGVSFLFIPTVLLYLPRLRHTLVFSPAKTQSTYLWHTGMSFGAEETQRNLYIRFCPISFHHSLILKFGIVLYIEQTNDIASFIIKLSTSYDRNIGHKHLFSERAISIRFLV